MKYELFIGLRYLKSKRKQVFISLVNLISVLGITIGVCALIVVISVMNGFDKDLMEKVMGMNAHISIENPNGIENYKKIIKKIEQIDSVEAASPCIMAQVILRSETKVRGLLIRGIDFSKEIKTSLLEKYIKAGEVPLLKNGKDNIIIGSQLASMLNINIGDTVDIISPVGISTGFGMVPILKELTVSGFFESGMYDYDANMAFVSLPTARTILNVNKDIVSVINVKIKNENNIIKSKKDISDLMDNDFKVRTWFESNKNLFSAVKLEKTVMFIILTLIIFVAAFNIISSLIMVVMEKNKDIGILKAMGASPKSLMLVFSFCGFMLGITGVILGLASGLSLCFLLKKYNFINLPNDIYYVSQLPVNVDPKDIIIIITSAIVISLLATIYPAYKASQVNPVEALRYE